MASSFSRVRHCYTCDIGDYIDRTKGVMLLTDYKAATQLTCYGEIQISTYYKRFHGCIRLRGNVV